jgi:fatty-acyl-CoA synthase
VDTVEEWGYLGFLSETALTSYAHGVAGEPLIGQTIGDNLEQTVARHPDREVIVSFHQSVRMTYAEFDAEVNRLARALMSAGLNVGDRVGVWSPNRVEWALVQYATAKAGIILVNINPAYRVHELQYALAKSSCRMLIAAAQTRMMDYVSMTEEARPELPELEHAVFFDTPSWDELLAGADGTSPDALQQRSAGLDFNDPINIQYTSGTTGFPKGATLSHHNILNNGFFVGEGCAITEEDRICVPVPYYHCFGMVMGNLAATSRGACVVLSSESFDPGAVLEAIQAERCTALYGVPTMFIAELAHPDFDRFDLTSLRTGIMAGAPCPVEVMRQVIDRMHMGEVTICYGMTETSPVSTMTGAHDNLEQRTSTVGSVMPHVEIRVADPDSGKTLPRGAPGEFQTRGYSVMLGYWNDPERTTETIDAARWMHTGDLATMDDDGHVRIVGRIKDMIIRGGENIYPREIEEFLYTHPAVADVQVIGIPSERYGEEVMAFVIPRGDAEVHEDELRDFCRGKIAHFKVPSHIAVCEEFPMTVTGKIQKYKLRERAVEDLGLGAAAGIKTA